MLKLTKEQLSANGVNVDPVRRCGGLVKYRVRYALGGPVGGATLKIKQNGIDEVSKTLDETGSTQIDGGSQDSFALVGLEGLPTSDHFVIAQNVIST